MATASLSAVPRRRRPPVLLVIAMVLCWVLVTLLLVWPERDEPTARDTYGALASSTFTEDLPLGIVLDRQQIVPSSDEGVARVSFFDVRRTDGASGGIVVVSYQVHRSADAARSAYETQFQAKREANEVHSPENRFFETEVTWPHTCVDEGQVFCFAVAGNVTVEALSRIHYFEPGQSPRVEEILGPALDHLERVRQSI